MMLQPRTPTVKLVKEDKRLNVLKEENARLTNMVGELKLQIELLKVRERDRMAKDAMKGTRTIALFV